MFTQTLFQLVQTHAQRLNLLRQMALINAVTQQFARHFPGITARQRTIDRHDQLIGLFKLTVRGLRDTHFLIEGK
ncbi:hypothetical protein D3C85_1736290 [compost metagenome]